MEQQIQALLQEIYEKNRGQYLLLDHNIDAEGHVLPLNQWSALPPPPLIADEDRQRILEGYADTLQSFIQSALNATAPPFLTSSVSIGQRISQVQIFLTQTEGELRARAGNIIPEPENLPEIQTYPITVTRRSWTIDDMVHWSDVQAWLDSKTILQQMHHETLVQ